MAESDANPALSNSSSSSILGVELSQTFPGTFSTEFPAQTSIALASIATSLSSISNFLAGSNLPQLLAQMSIANGVNGMLAGLVQAEGRMGLDARTVQQNATEIAHIIEKTITKVQDHLKASHDKDLSGAPVRDPEIKNAEKISGVTE